MKTETTRRAVVAGLAAAPVAGLPVIAGVVAQDDPIFAAIAEQRRCKTDSDEASAFVDRKYEELESARDQIAVIRFMGEKCHSIFCLDAKVRLKGSLSGDEITEYFKAHEALSIHEAALQRAEEKSGVDEAEDVFNEKNKAYFDAEMGVLATHPTTTAGALALLSFVAEHLQGPHRDPGQDYPEPLLGAIRNAATVLEREALS